MRQYCLPVLLAGQLIITAACNKQPEVAAPKPLKVVVQEAQVSDVPVYLELVGTIDGMQNAEIRARTPGYVESIHYKEGYPVKKGQLLFKIDPILAQANVTSAAGSLEDARALLAKSTADVARLKPLVAANAVSQQELDNALAAQQGAKARITSNEGSLQSAKANLSYTNVTSPIDGVAGLAKVRVGNLVGQSDPTLLTTVSTLDPVRVRFSFSEQQYLKLSSRLAMLRKTEGDGTGTGKPRQPLQLILADGSVYPHTGHIDVIERQLDIGTGTLAVDALFPNPDQMLRPGQYGKVRGQSDIKRGVVLVPQRAVRELQGGFLVGVVGAGNKVEIRPVIATDQVGSNWVIEKGLKAGELVIVEGLIKAKPGDVVETEKRAPAPVAEAPPAAPAAAEPAPPAEPDAAVKGP